MNQHKKTRRTRSTPWWHRATQMESWVWDWKKFGFKEDIDRIMASELMKGQENGDHNNQEINNNLQTERKKKKDEKKKRIGKPDWTK